MMQLKILSLSALLFATTSTSVHAGFQFTAPIQTNIPLQTNLEGRGNQLLPLPDENVAAPNIQPQPVPQVTMAPIQSPKPQVILPSVNQNARKESKPMPLPVISNSEIAVDGSANGPSMRGNKEIAVGFGDGLPLVTALRQVIPSDHTFVFEKDIPHGKTVSWQGGRPWDVVLADMLGGHGINYRIENNRVILSPKSYQATASEMAKATSPIAKKTDITRLASADNIMNDGLVEAQQKKAPTPIISQTPPSTKMMLPAPQVQISPPVQMQGKPMRLPQWTARNGDTLQNVLESWAGIADVDLFWSTNYNYPLMSDVNIEGNFETAVATLLEGFKGASPRPKGRLHPNRPEGPAVLVVETEQSLN